ncbi:MAG: hypothetical protein IPO21_06270 [Bacteroidales bacterium]|nr:hypothetical protein [Bacteroidales bacterium]
MNLKRLISTVFVMMTILVVCKAQDNKFAYGYVEKTSDNQLATHYAHIILESNQIIMNRLVIYSDSTSKEQGRQELKDIFYLTDKEISQLKEQLLKILENSKMPELSKVKKENILLSQDIEKNIDLNSKRNLLIIGEKTII